MYVTPHVFIYNRTQNICIVFAVWVYVLSAVVLVALLIIIVFVVKWKINKGERGDETQTHFKNIVFHCFSFKPTICLFRQHNTDEQQRCEFKKLILTILLNLIAEINIRVL